MFRLRSICQSLPQQQQRRQLCVRYITQPTTRLFYKTLTDSCVQDRRRQMQFLSASGKQSVIQLKRNSNQKAQHSKPKLQLWECNVNTARQNCALCFTHMLQVYSIKHIPGCFWRGLGRLVTHVWGHMRMLQGCRLPSRKNCLVSEMWMPPRGVLGRVLAGTRARQ